jgi:hypothetical protein
MVLVLLFLKIQFFVPETGFVLVLVGFGLGLYLDKDTKL